MVKFSIEHGNMDITLLVAQIFMDAFKNTSNMVKRGVTSSLVSIER